MGSISGEKAAEALHSYMGYAALESGAENVPTFQNVEIGGGHITGTEVTAEHPEGISFGMYHADQYVAPEGQYTTVHAVDGTAWYKQYAVDAVDKSPYIQGKYAGRVTDVHKGVVYVRLSNGVNAVAHSCYDYRMPGKKDDVSFAVTRLDMERGVAVGIITRIIRQNL